MPAFHTSLRMCRTHGSVSHAFIALHQAIDALSRLTGEPFTQIVRRLEVAHGFSRVHRGRWPDLAQIAAAAEDLATERAAWLADRNRRIAARRAEKARGRRQRDVALATIEAAHQGERPPLIGAFGWAKRR